MLTHPMLDQLGQLGLSGMAQAFTELEASDETATLTHADWTVERIRREATAIGPATAALCELILERRPHPEQGFRACLGIVRLVRPFGADRLEAAATRAIEIGTLTYGSVRSILDNKLDRQTAQPPANDVSILHPNIRGPRYYH